MKGRKEDISVEGQLVRATVWLCMENLPLLRACELGVGVEGRETRPSIELDPVGGVCHGYIYISRLDVRE